MLSEAGTMVGMDMHTFFIALHATAAAICLATGLAVVWPPRARAYTWLFRVFFVSLIGMVVFMIGAMVSHWTEIDTAAKLTFSGLLLLGFSMVYRAIGARAKRRVANRASDYIDDVGFVLIALVAGLVIVPVIRLETPVWLAVLIVLMTIFAGNRLLSVVHKRYARG